MGNFFNKRDPVFGDFYGENLNGVNKDISYSGKEKCQIEKSGVIYRGLSDVGNS